MKCGFVSIIGRPNVGKSTLLNHVVGEKLAGVSPKPQTTREVIRGIVTRPGGQIIFVDTPGLHDPRDPLGKWMVREAHKTFAASDLLYWMVLPGKRDAGDEKILESLRAVTIPVFLLVNQIDRYPKPQILPVLEDYHKAFNFRELIPISAKTGEQTDLLLRKTLEALPEGQPLFPADQLSDQNERTMVQEMIREKLYLFTGEEIPYASTVMIENFKEKSDKLVAIQAVIIVERDSQKAIVIGKKGDKIKQIGRAARLDIERFLGRKVFLELWVKTVEHWRRDGASLKKLGFQ